MSSEERERARAEKLAQQFHEAYERLAPQFGYKTRKDSAKPWADVPERNRSLMIAVCAEIVKTYGAECERRGREEALRNLASGMKKVLGDEELTNLKYACSPLEAFLEVLRK